MIRSVIVWVANITFLICATIITFSWLSYIGIGEIAQVLDVFGPLNNLGTIADPLIYHPDLHIVLQCLIYVIFLLGSSFLVGGIVYLSIWFIYQPAVQNMQTGDKAVDSQILVNALREIQIRGKKVDSISSIAVVALYIVELMGVSLSIIANPEIMLEDSVLKSMLLGIVSNPTLSNLL